MPQSCSAYNCTVKRKKGENITLHSFPNQGTLRDEWISALRRANFVPTQYSRICSNHFQENDYVTNIQGNRVLKKNAVPSKFCFENYLSKFKVMKREESSDTNVPSSQEENQPNSESLSPIRTMEHGSNIRKRKRSVPVYVNDFVEADLENPVKRHQYWNISQSAISKLRKTNKKYATMVCKYKKKINTLKDLLDDLKKRIHISSESSIVLEVITDDLVSEDTYY
ncbi:THAP domain-containing protein 1-like [Harmonia axyridis]|uniref:THAP domain-containing protein 1-like n=1 Tax=Harmonia axyridis TaxID=115357 RepID=UPI001E275FA2|nr:THAP domain-containing protein 1-like [Harmonia axyridis]XP_045477322.1 THAP domain-containing protein 1-like [Harmonia axyridis]XP_045477323.1 THAP domain-containing protein 1-like [Harmonia axyridis]